MTQRVLIVDDEQQICELYGIFFEQEGIRVSHAHSASECLARIRSERPDVVLLDINLASDDGLGVLTSIKQIRPETHVVMMTGMGFVDDLLREALSRGADGYVSKGLPRDELLNAVRRVMV